MSNRRIRTRRSKQLRHRMALQEWTETGTDEYGHSTGNWGNITGQSYLWADIKPVGERFSEYAHQLYSLATHRIRVDYRSDITAAKRLKYGDRIFWIGHIRDPDELGISLELLCSEDTNER